MKIRKLEPQDINQVLALGAQEDAFATSSEIEGFWPREDLERMVSADQDVLLAAEEGDNVIGFIFCFLHQPSGKATVENIFVHRDHRGKGIARFLITEALVRLKENGITYVCSLVGESNESSKGLFEALGFNTEKKFFWMDKEL